ncbi:MAG: flagellar basal body-associated FliL family protein [Deltaproteobacteria bacterium]|nr:flagellar basal body-associated FliL family protein [Deltaproteobacteria bacterium]
MADGTEKTKKEDQEKEPAAPAKSNKKILIIAIAAVAVLGVGAGAFFFLKGKPASTSTAETPKAEAAAEGSHGSPAEAKGARGEAKKGGASDLIALDPFIVNLQDNSGTRYLKLTLSLEVEGSHDEINAQTVRIRDSLIVLLSSKSYSDIGTVEGKYQMRDEIVARVNQFLTKSKIKSVYFSDMVIQ